MKSRVVASFDGPSGDLCVDVFVRGDGTYGFEEYRRDPEDMKGWFRLHRHGSLTFASEREALERTKAVVAWMADDAAGRTAVRARDPAS